MNHKTKGIVLKTVRYGETSIITTIFTELFGLQSYIVNGVRVSTKKGSGKANLFQPSAILDLIVYQNDLKNLQRIREFKWSKIYQHLFFSVFKNAVALFMVEMLQRTIKQPESHPELFAFAEDAFIHVDEANEKVVANFPLYFALHLSSFFGFQISDKYSDTANIIDLQEGEFVKTRPTHPHFLEGDLSEITSQLLKVMQPSELAEIRLNHETRRILLHAYEMFYALHIDNFGRLKTLPVLEEVLG